MTLVTPPLLELAPAHRQQGDIAPVEYVQGRVQQAVITKDER